MKKAILGIFISIGAFFLMSHNSYALDASINLNEYTPYAVDVGTNHFDYKFSSAARNCLNAYSCRFRYGSELKVAGTTGVYAVKKNDILVFQLFMYDNDWADWSLTNLVIRPIYTGTPSDVLYIHQVTNNTLTPTATGGVGGSNPGAVYEIAIKYRQDGEYHLGIYNETGVFMVLNTNQSVSGDIGPYIAISGMTMYRYTGSTENKEQAEATQNAADDSETSGSNSQSSSQGATNSLLSVFTGFANVITNASPSSCIINAPLNTTFSSDRLNVDLCGLDLPPAIGTLTSIIAVMVVVPFAISMFNKFIGIMQGFQR